MSNTVAESVENDLLRGLEALELDLSAEAVGRLLQFIHLLAKWNKAYNLTAIRDPRRMVSLHLLDSLAMLPWLQGDNVLDVGTGPGLPGIPLAIARPDIHFTLLDSNSKKTRFITQAVLELGIGNVSVVQSRAEAFQPDGQYSVIIARAFAGIPEMLDMVKHLCTARTRIIAMKGQYPTDELHDWPTGFVCESIEALKVPELEAARHVVLIHRERT
ncbi:MAG: 16S rRNA (guanine(527)-N(7))-methyltransferase RsmG [Gammaproteobacteria bacterium]|nr:16S rRNA (guanine(527)-N(7))-methyltransferase RsmG [Gammaproteobacteria bacterium]MDH5650529.1 16S rRNA (guanine(527)-N(7))-methyltransferase RsmG [Gammaproteobacteria bacterium]